MKASRRPGTLIELGDFTPPEAPPRPVRAWVPAHVNLARPHATLYLFDGQNVLDDHGSYAGGWHAHAAVDRLGRRDHEPVVLVAVGNGGVHRNHELGLGAASFIHAVARELVPRVEARLGGGGPRAVGGASLGGLSALIAWLQHPDLFEHAMVMSPSLWFNHRAVLHRVEQGSWRLPGSGRLYVDAGGRERGRMFADAEHLCRVLAARGLGPDRLRWRPDARGTHHERHWRRRFPAALRFLMRRQR